jgi:hypothetical protein
MLSSSRKPFSTRAILPSASAVNRAIFRVPYLERVLENPAQGGSGWIAKDPARPVCGRHRSRGDCAPDLAWRPTPDLCKSQILYMITLSARMDSARRMTTTGPPRPSNEVSSSHTATPAIPHRCGATGSRLRAAVYALAFGNPVDQDPCHTGTLQRRDVELSDTGHPVWQVSEFEKCQLRNDARQCR